MTVQRKSADGTTTFCEWALPPGVFPGDDALAAAEAQEHEPLPALPWYVYEDSRQVAAAWKKIGKERLERYRLDLEEMRAELRAMQKEDRQANRDTIGPRITARAKNGLTLADRASSGRRDRGVRRSRVADQSSSPSPWCCYPGTTSVTRDRFIIVPEGAAELAPDLPVYSLERYEACWLDLLRRLTAAASRGDGLGWLRLLGEDQKTRYGRPRLPDGTRPRVWNEVVRHMLGRWLPGEPRMEPIIECDGSYETKKYALGYRLTDKWRDADRVRLKVGETRYMRRVRHEVPVRPDGTRLKHDPWLDHCLTSPVLEFDLEGALRDILDYCGAAHPADILDYDALRAAIKSGSPTVDVLEEADAWKKARDKRTPLEIVRAQGLGQLAHVFAWRVDNLDDPQIPGRDPSGERFHTPVTSLAEHLRKHITLAGERVVCIDAVNSQMVFLAHAAHEELGTPDTLDALNVCAEGRFYEVCFRAIYGRDFRNDKERQRFKGKLMSVWLFVEGAVQATSKEGAALGRLWPNFHTWMLAQKITGPRDLPCRMQKKEAGVWIDDICPRLAALQLPCTPVHDSVLVPVSRAYEARQVIEQTYREHGLRARFKGGEAPVSALAAPCSRAADAA